MPSVGSILPFRNKLAYPFGVAPGFDPTHPASKGAVISIATLSGASTGASVNLLSGAKPAVSTGSLPGINAFIGPVRDFSSTFSTDQFTIPATTIASGTIAAIFVVSANSRCDIINGNGTGGGFTIQYNTAWRVVANSQSSFGNLVIGAPYFMAGSWTTGVGGNAVLLRLDTGQVFLPSTINLGASFTFTGTVNFAATNTTGSMKAAVGMISTVFLSTQQLLAWAADPWAFWYPRRTQIDWVGKIAAAAAPIAFMRRNIIRASSRGFR